MIPSLVTQFIVLFKDTSLASIIGFMDLTKAAQVVNNREIRPFELYLFIAVVYWVCTYSMSRYARYAGEEDRPCLSRSCPPASACTGGRPATRPGRLWCGSTAARSRTPRVMLPDSSPSSTGSARCSPTRAATGSPQRFERAEDYTYARKAEDLLAWLDALGYPRGRMGRRVHGRGALAVDGGARPGACGRCSPSAGRPTRRPTRTSAGGRGTGRWWSEKVIIGKRNVVELSLVALLAEGHVLLEDVPGVGKTMMVRALAKSVGADFKRIQFTPDLLPSDVTGVSIYNPKEMDFQFRPGPLMGNIILADEINRTSPKTQSALLEAMEEASLTIDGVTYRLEKPFFVMATQNPIEYEGTYPLPEAQLDRFLLKMQMGYPEIDEEIEVLNRVQKMSPIEELEPVIGLEELSRFAKTGKKSSC